MRSVWESYGRKVEPASLYLAQKALHADDGTGDGTADVGSADGTADGILDGIVDAPAGEPSPSCSSQTRPSAPPFAHTGVDLTGLDAAATCECEQTLTCNGGRHKHPAAHPATQNRAAAAAASIAAAPPSQLVRVQLIDNCGRQWCMRVGYLRRNAARSGAAVSWLARWRL